MYRMFYVSTKLYPSINLDIIWNGVVVNTHSLTWSHCWFKVVRMESAQLKMETEVLTGLSQLKDLIVW